MKHTKYEDYVCSFCFHNLPDCTCECGNFTLIQIDKGIQYPIRLLNEKGWITEYCCEGHYDDKQKGDTPYIVFDRFITLPSVPVGWKLSKSNGKEMINCVCKSKSKVIAKSTAEFEEKKKIAIENLITWVEGLDVNY